MRSAHGPHRPPEPATRRPGEAIPRSGLPRGCLEPECYPPTWLLVPTETCPGVTPQRGGRSLSHCRPTPATVLPREHLLGLSHRQPGWPAPARCSQAHPEADSQPRNPGARNRFGVAGQTYSSGDWPRHTTGWGSCLGHPAGSRRRAFSVPGSGGDRRGEKSAGKRETLASPAVAPWPAPQAADLGLRICSYGPGAPAGLSVCRRAPSQGRVSLRRPRRGGRRAAPRGREPGCGVSAGGRLALALGLCSATVAPPALRLREPTAPGHRAPGYKLRPGGGGR